MYLKRIFLILNIIFGTFIFAQNYESLTPYEKEYSELINYVPKGYVPDTNYKPESKILKTKLNTISSLRIYYRLRKVLKLTKKDEDWLVSRINYMATVLFQENKRILISSVGGYSGCLDKMVDTIKLNDIKITNLKFCYICENPIRDDDFIRIFNDRMYSLMKIEPKR